MNTFKQKIMKITSFWNALFSIMLSLLSPKKLHFAFCKIVVLLLFIFSSATMLGQSNSCSADLKVEKDRNTRSTPPEGTYYAMVLTNKGASSDTFVLSSANINTSCSNSDGSSSDRNVNLETIFLDNNLKAIKEVSLKAGQTSNFFVKIVVPKGTSIDKWNCTQIIAKSQKCTNYKADTILHTLVINPNEDK